MPNAKDATQTAQHRFLILGETGSGKTTQFLTLPGKKYAYLFDQNALLSLRGHDVDYDEWLPTTVSAAVSSLSKSKPGDKRTTTGSEVYMDWEKQHEERLANGFFDQYDWIAFDGATTLLDLIMDRVLSTNNRFGSWPGQDDWGPQMMAFMNICRSITAMGKGLYMTGHLEVKQDSLQRITRMPMMTGKLVVKIPLLFSDVLYADVDTSDAGNPLYRLQTIPDKINRTIRCSIKGLSQFENVTIEGLTETKDDKGKILPKQDPVGQGLGGILNWEKKNV